MLRSVATIVCMAGLLVTASHACGQNPSYPGYLGVRVYGHRYGMQIKNFIPDTPAFELAERGGIGRNDVITRLGGRPTRSMNELLRARDRIPDGMEAKMVLRDRFGDYYYVWIGRNDEAVAAAADGREPAMMYRSGGAGQGDAGEDFRPQGSSGGSSSRDSDDGGDFRPKF